jgi:hypothetical protein
MTQIERRVEATRVFRPDYSGKVFTDEDIAAGKHGDFIGGHWDTHGEYQLNFLTGQA